MILARDWFPPPQHPMNQPITHYNRKGHCEHRKVYATYFLLLFIYKINYILDLVRRASENPITCKISCFLKLTYIFVEKQKIFFGRSQNLETLVGFVIIHKNHQTSKSW